MSQGTALPSSTANPGSQHVCSPAEPASVTYCVRGERGRVPGLAATGICVQGYAEACMRVLTLCTWPVWKDAYVHVLHVQTLV